MGIYSLAIHLGTVLIDLKTYYLRQIPRIANLHKKDVLTVNTRVHSTIIQWHFNKHFNYQLITIIASRNESATLQLQNNYYYIYERSALYLGCRVRNSFRNILQKTGNVAFEQTGDTLGHVTEKPDGVAKEIDRPENLGRLASQFTRVMKLYVFKKECAGLK